MMTHPRPSSELVAGSDDSRENPYQCRIDRLKEYLDSSGLAGAVLSRPEHLRYFTGVRSGRIDPGFLVVTPSSLLLIVPEGSEFDPVSEELDVDLAPYVPYRADQFTASSAEACREAACRISVIGLRERVGVERDHLPEAVASVLDSTTISDLRPVLSEWRSVKDAAELAAIRRSVSLLDRAFRAIGEMMAEGVTELDVEVAARTALLPHLVEPLRLEGNIATGLRTTLPDPRASERVIRPGELVLVDLYPILDGYAADYTRMFVVGQPDPVQVERFEIVEEALVSAEEQLGPGVPAAVVDSAVRRSLADSGGWDESMLHHVGHGFGLSAWEEPWIGASSRSTLVPGNVVAIEPGLYLGGWGGIRLEGNYVITDNGYERLDSYPRQLGAPSAAEPGQ